MSENINTKKSHNIQYAKYGIYTFHSISHENVGFFYWKEGELGKETISHNSTLRKEKANMSEKTKDSLITWACMLAYAFMMIYGILGIFRFWG